MTDVPKLASDWKNQGDELMRQGRFQDAVEAYTNAVRLDPTLTKAMNNCAAAWGYLGQDIKSLEWFHKALSIDPANDGTLYNFCRLLIKLQKFEEMVASADAALTTRSDCLQAMLNKSMAYNALHRFDEALYWAEQALHHTSDNPFVLLNKGISLVNSGFSSEGLSTTAKAIETAFEKKNADSDFFISAGKTYFEAGEFELSLSTYQQALDLLPRSAGLHRNYAYTLLMLGNYTEAWPEFEWRLKDNSYLWHQKYAQPVWQNQSPTELAGPLLILSEEGLGDTIQFARYAILLAERSYKIVLEVYRELLSLFQHSFRNHAISVVPKIESSNQIYNDMEFSAYIPIMSLPYRMGTIQATILARTPYLAAPPHRSEYWRHRIDQNSSHLKVGLVWAGNPGQAQNSQRSIPITMIAPLLELKEIDFYSIRKGNWDLFPLQPSKILDIGKHISDFADTAAIIENLDLVISVCTSVAHLTGALGKPVWTMLAKVPDWRWGLEGDTTPWYPTMRLFRQPKKGDWPSVVAEVGKALDELVASKDL